MIYVLICYFGGCIESGLKEMCLRIVKVMSRKKEVIIFFSVLVGVIIMDYFFVFRSKVFGKFFFILFMMSLVIGNFYLIIL